MANNFHDVGGLMLVGIDLHDALLLPGVPLAPLVPIPRPKMPHINFLHPFSMGGNQKSTVQFNGRDTVVHWHQPGFLWPHLNLLPFPIDILIPLHIVLGSQTAWLPRGTVFIEGETATCTNIAGPMSIDLDCWEVGNIPSSLVIQPSTVQTSPTLADYAAGVMAVAVDFAMEALFSFILNKSFDAVAARVARRADGAVARSFDAPSSSVVPNGSTGDVVDGAFPDEAIDDVAPTPQPVPVRLITQEQAARNANWKRPNGRWWYPPNDGFVTPTPDANYVLKPGDTFDRYGGRVDPVTGVFSDPHGIYVSPTGVPYGARALPPGTNATPPRAYRVADGHWIPVRAGEVAPWFDEVGGGTQWVLPDNIDNLIATGVLVPV